MREEDLPKGVKNPYLKGENKTLPVGIKTSNKSLKMKLVSAGVLQKWCLWVAHCMRKMMVELEF